MHEDSQMRRRQLLGTTGSILAVSLAGCAGGEPDDQPADSADGSGGTDDDSDGGTPVDAVADRTDQDSVRVDVGAGSGLQFDPAEIRISPGTTVRWVWTGEGGGHNVVEDEGAFASHQNRNVTDEAGYSFEHRFTESGSYDYVCQPHSKQGMVGSVEVVE